MKNIRSPRLQLVGFIAVLSFTAQFLFAQEKTATVACIAFYNVENLFDTIDSFDTNDLEYLPQGSKQWDSRKYSEKITNLARVISEIGTDLTPDGPAILGLSEVENKLVLNDLVNDPQIRDRGYRIAHYDSPDRRGVDVALIYQPKYFTYLSSKPFLFIPEGRENFYSRDVLLVSGLLHGELMHILVNHWPSRRGGERASRPLRNAAAQLNRKIVDSLQLANPTAHIIIMGDLNDDPINESVKKHLQTGWDKNKLKENELFNPYYDFYRKGIGTLAYRDSWNLFDMIILNQTLLTPDKSTYTFFKADVFNKRFLLQTQGQFAGYPLRTHAGDTYLGGFSDHFPVYIYLVREK
jgi:hypothetical protein